MPINPINDPEKLWSRLVAWFLDEPYDEKRPPEPFKNLEEEINICFLLSHFSKTMEEYLKDHGIK